MAEEKKKAPVERKFISASEAKAAAGKAAAKEGVTAAAPAEAPKPQTLNAAPVAEKGKPAGGLRIGAIVLWLLGIACEVAAILLINKTLSLPGSLTTWLIVAIVADMAFVIIGSQLWKKANHQDPASEANKLKFWLWNNMGVIAAVVAFFPLIIVLLRSKDLDPKTKKLVTVIAVIALLITGTASYDWNPVSQEDLEAQRTALAATGTTSETTVYWTPFGKSYHLDPNCQALKNSSTVISGTLDEAFEAKRTDPCDFCAKEAAAAAKEAEAAANTATTDQAA